MQLDDLTSYYLLLTDIHKMCWVGVTLICGAALYLQGRRLAPCLPRGIISLEMPRSKGEASRCLECLEQRGLVATARMQIRVDFGFIALYALSTFFVFEALAGPFDEGQRLTPVGWLGTKYVGAVLLAAGMFDAIENVAILRMLSGKVNGQWPLAARICAVLKFALLGLASIAVLIAGLAYFGKPIHPKIVCDSLLNCSDHPTLARVIPAQLFLIAFSALLILRGSPSARSASVGTHTIDGRTYCAVLAVLGSLATSSLLAVSGSFPSTATPYALVTALIVAIDIALIRLATDGGAHCSGTSTIRLDEFKLLRDLAPAWCGVGLTLVVTVALYATAYLSRNAECDAMCELFVALKRPDAGAIAVEFGSLAYRGITLALTIVSAWIAAWTAAGIWSRCSSPKHRNSVLCGVVLLGLSVAGALAAVGRMDVSPGYGSALGNVILCATWARMKLPWLSSVSDSMNVVGVFAPTVVGFGACLLLEPMSKPASPSEASQQLVALASRLRTLDHLLYAGALCLVLGTLQVSAVYSLAVAALPTTTDVKAKSELCKTVTVSPRPGKAYADVDLLKCDQLVSDAQRASIGDGVKQFIRSITVTFGISFSALLAALYVPAALRLQSLATTASGVAVHANEEARHERLRTLGLESDLMGKAVTVIATLSPLFAGLISNTIGTAHL